MRKMSEDIFGKMLRAGKLAAPPLEIKVLGLDLPSGQDALVEVSWKKRSFRYCVELKNNAKPQSLINAVSQAKRYALQKRNAWPMVVAPYLSAEKLDDLLAQGVSAIDFCGNAAIEAPGKFFFYKTGNPNQFPESLPIRSAYRGDGSLVPRVLLLQRQFQAVGDILRSIQAKKGSLTFGAVSKVLQRLEEDLVIERPSRSVVRVIQPDQLLDGLLEAYQPPKVQSIRCGKTDLSNGQLLDILANESDVIRTGDSSASEYAAWASEPILSYYCREEPSILLNRLNINVRETPVFANLRLIQTLDQRVYFDPRPNQLASPIQSYLEMATGDKRQKEAAEQIKNAILNSTETPT